ncbi:MAG: TIR domain-containing protein, partial [Ignavibacteriota bacterium]
MADIFISYSSKDREKAEQLTELLASAGLSVWIDNQGIDMATSWSEEIVRAISGCRAFVVMLSPNSITSHNVIKEVSLASEKRKKILPLDLEPVEIPESMQYALAGIQRSPMTNIDAIIRALGKLGLEATKTPELKLIKETDSRKSLMILPFEDLSPTADNGWFTDGVACELVNSLSNVKALKIIDWNTSRMFKERKTKTVELAKEFSVQYFIEGQVRKFGDQIKISVNLLDIETGDHLWQDSLRGTMDDIFDIQEQVASNVLKGLKIHLTKDEKVKIEKKPTENPEAYELFLKGGEYFERQTKT